MKITRRKMFASLGLLPVAMLPTAKSEAKEVEPTTVNNVTFNVKGSLIHESQIREVIVKTITESVKRGQISFIA